jgi:hypothetical protein
MKIRNGALLGGVVAVGFALIGCSEGSDAASEAGEAFDRTLGSVEAAADPVGESAAQVAGEAEQWAEGTAGETAENAADAADEAADDARKTAERRGEAVSGSIDSLDAGSPAPGSS